MHSDCKTGIGRVALKTDTKQKVFSETSDVCPDSMGTDTSMAVCTEQVQSLGKNFEVSVSSRRLVFTK